MTYFVALLIYCAAGHCLALQGDQPFAARASCEAFLDGVAREAPTMLRRRSFCREFSE